MITFTLGSDSHPSHVCSWSKTLSGSKEEHHYTSSGLPFYWLPVPFRVHLKVLKSLSGLAPPYLAELPTLQPGVSRKLIRASLRY